MCALRGQNERPWPSLVYEYNIPFANCRTPGIVCRVNIFAYSFGRKLWVRMKWLFRDERWRWISYAARSMADWFLNVYSSGKKRRRRRKSANVRPRRVICTPRRFTSIPRYVIALRTVRGVVLRSSTRQDVKEHSGFLSMISSVTFSSTTRPGFRLAPSRTSDATRNERAENARRK